MSGRSWALAGVAGIGLIAIVWLWNTATRNGGLARPGAAEAPTRANQIRSEEDRRGNSATNDSEVRAAVPVAISEPSGVFLSGRVVDSEGGRAIARASVCAAAPRHPENMPWIVLPLDPARNDSVAGSIARAESDANGAFRLRLEEATDVEVAVRRSGHVGLDLVRAWPAGAHELDLGALTLPRAAALPGRVVDEADRSIAGARVLRTGYTDLDDEHKMDWGRTLLATSDAAGAFVLDALALGRTSVEVCAPGFVPEQRELFADAYELPEWRLVLARAAPITGRVVGAPPGLPLEVYYWRQDLKEQFFSACGPDGSFAVDGLPADFGAIDLTVAEAKNHEAVSLSVSARPGQSDVELRVPLPSAYRLRVVDGTSGAPLSDVHLALQTWASPRDDERARVSTSEAGLYTLSILVPGMDEFHALFVSRDGYEGVALGQLPFTPGETADLGSVSLTPLEQTTLRVLDDASGAPVAGARIQAEILRDEEDWNDTPVPWPARSVLPASWNGTSAADGTAIARLSASQRYRITVQHDAHAPLEKTLQVSARAPAQLDLRLAHGGTVSVLCLDTATRAPLGEQAVEHMKSDDGERWSGDDRVMSGADGRARFEHLAPGLHRFSFAEGDHGERPEVATVTVTEGAAAEVTLLRRPAELVRLRGIVTERGRPLAGAMVDAWEREAATDIEGRYEIDGLEPQELDVVVTHPKYGLVSTQRVALRAPETRLDIDLELVALHGLVRDAAGQPIAGAGVHIDVRNPNGTFDGLRASAFGQWLHATESDASGSFLFAAVRPEEGLYLVVQKGGYLTERVSLVFPSPDTALELAPLLQPAATLALTLQGFELASQVSARWLGGDDLALDDREQKPENAGAYEKDSQTVHLAFESLRPGRWRIEVHEFFSFEEPPLASAEVEVHAGANPPLVLRP